MNLLKTIKLIKSDFYRLKGRELPLRTILWHTIVTQAQGEGWMTYFRLAQCGNRIVSLFGKIMKRHYSHKYCIDIGTPTKIGKGFYFGHGMCIVVHMNTVIGNNVNISQFVNIDKYR